MEFVLRIELDNDAFQEDRDFEIAYILREVADSVAGGQTTDIIRDENGNRVGMYGIEKIM